jgi:hypothetical protein
MRIANSCFPLSLAKESSMRFLSIALVAVLLGLPLGVRAAAVDSKVEIEQLKKEIELLKRENDLLKRENELLKKQLAAVEKADPASKSDKPAAAFKTTVNKVDYVYQGTTRNGEVMTVTLLATSQDGNQPAPTGQMTIIDEKGERYTGRRSGGFNHVTLREGVATRITWQFGGTGGLGLPATPAPSAKISQFPSVVVETMSALQKNTIEFRNVPAVVREGKGK